MTKLLNPTLARELCEAFGLDPRRVTGMTMHFHGIEAPLVQVDMVIEGEPEVLKRVPFRLVPASVEGAYKIHVERVNIDQRKAAIIVQQPKKKTIYARRIRLPAGAELVQQEESTPHVYLLADAVEIVE